MAEGLVLGLIPARAGSKGVPDKNLRPLAGRTLLDYVAEAARASRRLDRLVLSTDSDTLFTCVRETPTTHAESLIAAGDFDGNGTQEVAISDGVTITMFYQDQGG